METIEKVNVANMKSDIKEMAEKQRFYKNQRRTTKLVGDRKLDPWKATCSHQTNREDLRVMYAAYGVARGKSFNEIENHFPEEGHPLNNHQNTIDRILKRYTEKVEVEIETEI